VRDSIELKPVSQQPRTDPIGSIEWTERTGGVLTARECLTLARPLLRGELRILAGRLAMVLRMHSGRRSSIDPSSLVPPDSRLARDAEVAAQDLLTPALLNHSSRAYTWGAAIAALHGITFDRELLYLAAMFHDTGIPSPVPDVDFTVRSAAVAREFTDSHHVPADKRELVANAIAMHHTPGVGLESGAEAYLLSAGAALDVFGQNRQPAGAHLGKAAGHHDFVRRAALGPVDLEDAVLHGRHERRVAFQHAELAFAAGDDDHVDILAADEPGGSDEFEVQHLNPLLPSRRREGPGVGSGQALRLAASPPQTPPACGRGLKVHQASSASFLAFSTASSMPPTM